MFFFLRWFFFLKIELQLGKWNRKTFLSKEIKRTNYLKFESVSKKNFFLKRFLYFWQFCERFLMCCLFVVIFVRFYFLFILICYFLVYYYFFFFFFYLFFIYFLLSNVWCVLSCIVRSSEIRYYWRQMWAMANVKYFFKMCFFLLIIELQLGKWNRKTFLSKEIKRNNYLKFERVL